MNGSCLVATASDLSDTQSCYEQDCKFLLTYLTEPTRFLNIIQVSHRGVNIRPVLKVVEVEQKQKHVSVWMDHV